MAPTSSILSLIALASQASAWGTLGHETVAYIAQNFVSANTKTFAQGILANTSTSYLAGVATWADTYRYTAEGSFSAPLHFIDAMDNPPSSCSVDYDRDCPEEGCIVGAIANYTSRVADTSLSTTERQKALKWIVHFLGDVHQPLHVENIAVGGNDIDVTFDGTATNLHHIWDTNMPEKLVGGYSYSDAQNWATTLTADIKTGQYKSQAASWLTGMTLSDSIGSAMIWAKDANAHVCDTALPQGEAGVENKELDSSYYNSAIPVIELQIAKAGYRLAAWLNLIATGKTKRDVEEAEAVEARSMPFVPGMQNLERKEISLEQWMIEARRARRAFGWNCGPEGHSH